MEKYIDVFQEIMRGNLLLKRKELDLVSLECVFMDRRELLRCRCFEKVKKIGQLVSYIAQQKLVYTP